MDSCAWLDPGIRFPVQFLRCRSRSHRMGNNSILSIQLIDILKNAVNLNLNAQFRENEFRCGFTNIKYARNQL